MSSQNSRVFPQGMQSVAEGWYLVPFRLPALGCLLPLSLAFGLAVMAGFKAIQPPQGSPWEEGCLRFFELAGAAFIALCGVYHIASKIGADRADARWRTQTADYSMSQARASIASANHSYDAANAWLDTAEREFSERAFSPFWEAIQSATLLIEQHRTACGILSQYRVAYYKALADRNHDFPVLEESVEPLFDPDPVTQRLMGLVRKGQTDFQFATIWESIKMRQVMVAGFQTLAEGIQHLERSIVASLADLKQSVDLGFGKLLSVQTTLSKAILIIARDRPASA